MSKLHNLLGRLKQVKRTGKNDYIACCPAHNDKSPSMTIREVEPDHLLVHCFAGCSITEVLESVGMGPEDVFPDKVRDSHRRPSKVPYNPSDVLKCVYEDSVQLYLFFCQAEKHPESFGEVGAIHMKQKILNIIAAARMARGDI